MEEKKLDVKSIIGFVLIFGILIFMFYQNKPTPEELEAQKAKQDQMDAATAAEEESPEELVIDNTPSVDLNDSTAVAGYKSQIGAFSYTTPKDGHTVLENEVLYLEISNKGGHVVQAKMKSFVTYDSVPVYLVKDGNSAYSINFSTSDNRVLNTKDLYFEPSVTQSGDNQVLSMRAKTSNNQYL